MKAWHYYLITVLALPTLLVLSGFQTGEGLGYDIGSMTFWVALVGGLITLGIHLAKPKANKIPINK